MSGLEDNQQIAMDESNPESKSKSEPIEIMAVQHSDENGSVPQEENEAEPMEGDVLEAANEDQADDQEDVEEDAEGLNELEDFDVEGSPDESAHQLPAELLEDATNDSNAVENTDTTQTSDIAAEDSRTVSTTALSQTTTTDATSSAYQSISKDVSSSISSETKTTDSSVVAGNKGVKDESSRMFEGGDDSFVVQVDDTMLREIDADLLDSSHPDAKNSEADPSSAAGAKVQSSKQGGATQHDEAKADSEANTENVTKTATQTADSKDSKQATTIKDEKESKTAPKSASAKVPRKDEKASQSSRNLWVSGLSSSTRATDLKTLFSKHGKVVGAKVVTNARSPGSRCYGFVTMGSADDATKCIQHLHRTELHGRMISVERAKTEPQGTKAVAKVLPPSSLKSPTKSETGRSSSRRPGQPRREERERVRPARDDSNLTEKEKKELDVLSFEKIKAERERERLRRKEMYLRHEERRRQMDLEREEYKQRMIEKRQREETMKIERERKRLREMREDLERERMETERLRLETERMEMERQQESYRREQQRVLQDRRPLKRTVDRGNSRDEEWHGSKRIQTERFHQAERGHFDRKERFDRRDGPDRSGRFERPERGGGRHERYENRDRAPREREPRDRDFSRRDDHRPSYREDRSRDGRSNRDERTSRDERNPTRHDSRSEWKSDRESSRGSGGGSNAWNGPVDHKLDGSWGQAGGQGDGWENGGVISQPASGTYSMQQGPMMGGGHVFIAQPAMQGTPVMMQTSMPRQNDSRYGMATGTVRRF